MKRDFNFTTLPVFILLILVFTANAFAISSNGNNGASRKSGRLSTDVRFDGQEVGGKLQNPLEALSVVENEKSIDDLIGVRKNFKDRSEKAKGLR
jgi:hypothetical protein